MTHCPSSHIPSFKSNRFNCFFEASAALIFNRHDTSTFSQSGILDEDNFNLKLQAFSLEMEDNTLLCLLCAVALIYLKVKGPYWILVNTKVEYADFHFYVKSMMTNFRTLAEDASKLLNPSTKSVFDDRDGT